MHDDDDPNFEIITDRHGRKVRVLRDGGRTHVRFRDAESARAAPARAQAVPTYDGRQPLTDADKAALRGCRPGYRVLLDSDGRPQRRPQVDAYAKSEAAMCDAWKDPPKGLGRWRDGRNGNGNGNGNGFNGVGSGGFVGAQEGDACTVRGPEYPDDFGSPGHLQWRNGSLQCVPDDGDDGDDDIDAASDSSAFADAQMDAEQQRELAYRDYIRDVSSRWRRG
jgi:hypothetical protein